MKPIYYMVIIMEVWKRLDEVIGSGLLTSIAIYAINQGVESIALECVLGIIALFAVKNVIKKNGGDK
jgi:hypothetical protein